MHLRRNVGHAFSIYGMRTRAARAAFSIFVISHAYAETDVIIIGERACGISPLWHAPAILRGRVVSRHRQIMNLKDSKPIIGTDVFVAPSASVIGQVELGASSSIWYGAVLRGDVNSISVGECSSIQDRTVLHASDDSSGAVAPTVIGANVTVGHGSVIKGATVGDESFIGTGVVVGNGSVISKGAMIAAGSNVAPDSVIGEGELWMGNPAQFSRKLTADESEAILAAARDNVSLAAAHNLEAGKTHEQIESEKLRQKLLDERSDDYNSHLGLLGKERELVETQARIIEGERQLQAKVGSA